MSNLISIDPGTLKFGWAVFNAKGKLIESAGIKLDNKAPLPERLKEICRIVDLVMERHSVTKLALEESFYGKNITSYGKLMMARGAIIACAVGKGATIHEYAPKTVKMYFCGNSSATKEEMVALAKAQFGIDKITEDQADAIGIGVAHFVDQNARKLSGHKALTGNTAYRANSAPRRVGAQASRALWTTHLAS